MDERSIREVVSTTGRLFGYSQIKSHQFQIIESFVKGHDVFGVLPTGYGKSFCYAGLPIILDRILGKPPGTTIVLVVSPLVVIMKDQVYKAT